MNSIIYKITVFTVVCLFAMQMQAQQKHEFSIYGGGGLSTLNYKLNNVNDDKVNSKAGYMAGIGYTFFFSRQWGVATGAELATYKSESELYSVMDTHETVDDYGDNFDFILFQKGLNEEQEAQYINIPLMIQFQAKDDAGFYAAFGGKIGVPTKGKYKYSYNSLTTKGYYPSLNVMYDDVEYRRFGTFGGKEGRGDLNFKTAFMVSAEIGMKWSLDKSFSLYTGAYADYGLNDVVKDGKNEKLLPYNNENPTDFRNNSVLNSEYNHYWDKKSLAGKVRPLAVGLKIKMSFSVR